MDIRRAKEISTFPETLHVTLNGTPIYIQHVDEQNETARVFPLEDPENEQVVSVNSLKEE